MGGEVRAGARLSLGRMKLRPEASVTPSLVALAYAGGACEGGKCAQTTIRCINSVHGNISDIFALAVVCLEVREATVLPAVNYKAEHPEEGQTGVPPTLGTLLQNQRDVSPRKTSSHRSKIKVVIMRLKRAPGKCRPGHEWLCRDLQYYVAGLL